ncbi:MAG TPA: AI-2E family transporter [Ktedonobacteraceae bacterium]|nr:AI-2E family transporter [Ktedonobacteraceae bacterium]
MSSNSVEQNTSLHHITARAVWMTRLIISLTVLVCLLILGIVLYALSLISGAVIILIVSALLAYIIYPVVHFLQRYLPRPLAITVAYLVIVSLLAAVLYVVITSLIQQSASLVQYVQFLFTPQGQKQIQPIITFLQNLGITQSQLEQFKGQVIAQLQGIITGLLPLLTSTFSNIISFIVIITLSVYFIVDGGRVVRWFCNKTPIAYRGSITLFIHMLDQSVGGYFRGLLLLASIGGICTGIFLALLHVPFAALLAVIFFLFFFIPMIGGYISGILTVLASIPQGWVTVVIVIAFTVLLQQIILGQIVAPRIFSKSIGLHPIIALFALFAGGELFGVLGGFLAVPIAGVIQEVIEALWKHWKIQHPEQFPVGTAPLQQPLLIAENEHTLADKSVQKTD